MPSMRLVIACLLACIPLPAAAAERLVWFGTSTNAKTGAEGIYVSRFDDASGTLTAPVLATAARNPSFLALHPRLPMLYAVAEATDAAGKPVATVRAFAIDEATGTLTARGHEPSGGAGPCHVSVDAEGRVVLAANYGGGSAICLGLEADGGLKPVVAGPPGGFIQHVPAAEPEATAAAPRPRTPRGHSIDSSPDGRFAYVCDLGLDTVFVHGLDRDRATLAFHSATPVAAGAGPRHFALHPSGRFGYSVNELDLTVTAFSADARAGTLTVIDSLSTLPAGVTDRGGFSAAEIAVHPTGKFLYASNRGHDSIAMYAIDGGSGRLSFLGTEPIRGARPRHFALDPAGRFLLAGGQDSHTVTVFAIDPETGRLAFTGASVAVRAPVCILFARQPAASSSSR